MSPTNVTTLNEPSKGDRVRGSVCAFGLVAVVFCLYGRVATHEFVDWDDNHYVYENARIQDGLRWENMVWALTASDAANWHPLTWWSHMLDCELFGLDAGKHLLVNVFFHALNAALAFWVLRSLMGSLFAAALAAALFAVHPLRVESVAWVSERKDLLSGLFFWLTVAAYGRYAGRGGWLRYGFVVVLLTLGLMTKPMLVTLPCVLLLLDAWPLRRFGRVPIRVLVAEKIPLFGLCAASCAVTWFAQKEGGAVVPLAAVPFGLRLENAIVSYFSYLAKFVWPVDLAFFYPHPVLSDGSLGGKATVAAAILLLFTSVAAFRIRESPYLMVGWLWYLGMSIPVIGILQVGGHSFADRYTYLPMVGIAVLLSWSLSDFVSGSRSRTIGVVVAAGIVLTALATVTWRQVSYWRDSVALFERAIAVTDNNDVAYHKLANEFSRQGDSEGARAHYLKALAINPHNAEANHNLAVVFTERGEVVEAARYFEGALRAFPGYAKAHYGLGLLGMDSGDLDRATSELERALELDPEMIEALNNLGVVLARQGRFKEAIERFERALAIDPDYGDAARNLQTARKRL